MIYLYDIRVEVSRSLAPKMLEPIISYTHTHTLHTYICIFNWTSNLIPVLFSFIFWFSDCCFLSAEHCTRAWCPCVHRVHRNNYVVRCIAPTAVAMATYEQQKWQKRSASSFLISVKQQSCAHARWNYNCWDFYLIEIDRFFLPPSPPSSCNIFCAIHGRTYDAKSRLTVKNMCTRKTTTNDECNDNT